MQSKSPGTGAPGVPQRQSSPESPERNNESHRRQHADDDVLINELVGDELEDDDEREEDEDWDGDEDEEECPD